MTAAEPSFLSAGSSERSIRPLGSWSRLTTLLDSTASVGPVCLDLTPLCMEQSRRWWSLKAVQEARWSLAYMQGACSTRDVTTSRVMWRDGTALPGLSPEGEPTDLFMR